MSYINFFMAGWLFLTILLFLFVPPYNTLYSQLKSKEEVANSSSKPEYHSKSFFSTSCKGKSQFTNIGGRTEIFDVEKVKLICIGGNLEDPESTWQLNAEVSDVWFASHTLTGPVHVRCNAGQLIHYDELPLNYYMWDKDFSSSESSEDFWQEFHSADIAFKNRKPVSVIYRHMRFGDGEWTEVASYSAKFDEVVPLLEK